MTNEELIADLKQFITATVRGEINEALEPVNRRIDGVQSSLEQKIADVQASVDEHRAETQAGFAGVADAINVIHETLDDHQAVLDRHEQAIAELRTQSAA